MKIKIESGDLIKEAELYEGTAPQTVKAVLSNLPIESEVNTWGDEIYFTADIGIQEEENSHEVVEMGDVAYWVEGKALCIFFGKTPMSSGDEIVPAGPVNVIGKVTGDEKDFKQVKDGAPIKFITQGE
ncbi:MAG: cyclophilin-like fold protein [Archaeoglobaceae archaeon]